MHNGPDARLDSQVKDRTGLCLLQAILELRGDAATLAPGFDRFIPQLLY